MKKFAFISRHEVTQQQHQIANAMGIELIGVGDVDAFGATPDMEGFDGAIVVNAWLALRLAGLGYSVGVFENTQRPVEGGKPTFEAKALHIQWMEWKDGGAEFGRWNNSLEESNEYYN